MRTRVAGLKPVSPNFSSASGMGPATCKMMLPNSPTDATMAPGTSGRAAEGSECDMVEDIG
jgi:hypothetical protein